MLPGITPSFEREVFYRLIAYFRGTKERVSEEYQALLSADIGPGSTFIDIYGYAAGQQNNG